MRRLMKLQSKVLLLASLALIPALWAFAGPESQKTTSGSSEVRFRNFDKDPGLIQNSRQLTFQGPRSGEGYFSADGKKMVFQSERMDGNPFYQIYLMDLQTGETNLVSTGSGKTTCAWIHPSGQKILYGSTHLDSQFQGKVKEELESRKAAQKGKYSWSFDDQFDIFESAIKGQKPKRLTKELGYDAEGAYSPDGQWIVFASNRAAYTEKLSEEDQKIFAQDPSYMMDIYLMKSDGSQVRRLTTSKGYDGGPFFSADGKQITWRRFAPNGQSAEIHVMNVDGSGDQAVTRMKAMSWAPFFHPSGDYLIFTSNVLGFSNFELFIADAKGLKDPVRVSYLDGFDGLPVFTPDGQKISWTRRNEKGESQIYMADWNDLKARELLGLSAAVPQIPQLGSGIQENDLKSWVSYLASPELGGRPTGSDQEKEYTRRLAEAFQAMGLKPAVGKDFVVPFTFTSDVSLGEKNSLIFKSENREMSFKAGEDFVPLSFSKTGDFAFGTLAVAGYGITAPASESQSAYDSYKNLDVHGKWVLVFKDIPESIPNERRIHMNLYSRIQHKAMVAKNNGAIGLLVVNGPNAFGRKLTKLKFEGGNSETSIPVLSVSDKVAEELVKSSGKTLKQWQDANDRGDIVTGLVEKAAVRAQVQLNFKKSQGLNVIAKLTVPGAKSSVMIGGHGDHLGRGELGNSLARNEEQSAIHAGADDNASGVSAVMEIAQSLSSQAKSGQLKLKQNVLFAVWSGEEIGLLGSSNYLKERKDEKITSYLNMDMIGRLRGNLLVQGVGSAKEWRGMMEKEAAQTDLSLSQQDDPYVPTDGMAFYMQQIPSVTFFTGSHAEYHSPRDLPESLNYPGIVKIASLVEKMTVQLASHAKGLTYSKVESSQRKLEGRSFRIFLGTIPDYTQEGVKGVKISGTSKDSPAEKAGLQPGDVILELASTKIENLYDYVYCLQAMKANEPTIVKINRLGKIMDLKITPTLKE